MPHIPGHVDGLLNQNPPPPPGGSRPPSLLGDVEQWAESPVGQMDPLAMAQETNRQRAMAGMPGYPWIGPQPSRKKKILDHLRYSVPRMVGDFGKGLARETPRGLLDLARTLGAESVGGPGGWITNLIDQPWSPQAPETGAGKAGGFGGMMASEVAAGLISDAASATRGVRELADPEGSTKLGLLELASSVPFLGMAAVPLVASTRAAIKASRGGLDAVSNSRLEKFFLDTQQGKATGSQWLATLKKAPGGIPEGEMEWTGITKLLGDNPDRKFTRAELQQHMADNGIKLKETWRGGSGKYSEYTGWDDASFESELARRTNFAQRLQAAGDHDLADEMFRQVDEITHAQEELAGFGPPGTPKFNSSDLRIEGPSENYRELTIQLEQPNQPRIDRLLKEQEELATAQWGGRTPYRTPDGDWVGLPPKIQVKYNALTEQIHSLNRPPEFEGPHWSENNVLVHLRMSDRTVINPKTGKPETVLFIEEIQSDWHQKGRDKGYVDLEKMRALNDEVRAADEAYEALQKKHGVYLREARRNHDNALVDGSGEVEKWWKIQNDLGKAEDRLKVATRNRTQMDTQIPQGPYQNVDEWSELAMKRAIQEGVDGGYDRVAWASGRQASELYNLRKKVSSIDYNPDTGHLEAYDLDGDRFITERGVTPEQLPDYIGKEPADRLLSAEASKSIEYYIEESFHPATKEPDFRVFESRGEHDIHRMNSSHSTRADAERRVTELNEAPAEQTQFRSIEGEDLEVGGEGMIGFYDRIIPRMTNKYGNQVGGIEIENVAVSGHIPNEVTRLSPDQLNQGVLELGLADADDPLVKKWIQFVNEFSTTPDGAIAAGFNASEQKILERHYDKILKHFQSLPLKNTDMINQSFAITPEMRAKVGQEGQRLYSATGPGLLGTSAVARQLDDEEQNQQRGLLQPPIGPPLIPRR